MTGVMEIGVGNMKKIPLIFVPPKCLGVVGRERRAGSSKGRGSDPPALRPNRDAVESLRNKTRMEKIACKIKFFITPGRFSSSPTAARPETLWPTGSRFGGKRENGIFRK